jgi:capsular exopolysaccharide synthesis family protein
VETPAEVEARIGVRPLGTIPRFEDLDKARVKPKHFVDDCRTIRVNLMLAAGEKQARVLVIASPQGRDGKTTLAINLATSIALTGKRVLLIDGDVRKPEVARYLRVNNSKGLSNVLAGECDFEEAVQPTMLATLSVLPSNRKAYRQNEMVARSSLADILAKARATFDEIIIDTPAVLAMPDAKLWATMADGVILVARSGKTSAKNLVEAKTRMQQAGARILGVVLTGVRIGDSYEKYQHRYGEGYVDEPVSEDDWNATRVFLLSRQLAEGDGESGGQGTEGGEKREEAS